MFKQVELELSPKVFWDIFVYFPSRDTQTSSHILSQIFADK